MNHPTLDPAEMDPMIRTFDYRGVLVELFLYNTGDATCSVYDRDRGDYVTPDFALPWGGSPATWAGIIMARIRAV